MTNPVTAESLQSYLEHNEGYSNTVYPDSAGIPTVGIGHNLPANCPDAINGLTPDASNPHPSYDEVLNNAQALSDAQVTELYTHDMNVAIDRAHDLFPNFDSLPTTVQAALADMSFNLGDKLAEFHHLADAVSTHDWSAAVDAMVDSDWADQVAERAERDQWLMYAPEIMGDIQTGDIHQVLHDVMTHAHDFSGTDGHDSPTDWHDVPGHL